MLENYGYFAEVHKVLTEDGYILELHRIPKSHSGKPYTRNHPVLIPNCLLGSSADYIIAGPKRSLPMQLADDGYDVWLANSRGNTYSRQHEWLSVKGEDYWNFSLHELGIYDLPATIDYILETTNTKQLHFIGFSMSTSTFLILASERPMYQKKIRSHISLAPVANIANSTSSFKKFAPYVKSIGSIVRETAHGAFLTNSDSLQTFLNIICREKFVHNHICLKTVIFAACGSDPYYFDQKLFPLINGHYPAGTSSKLVVHYSQFLSPDNFGQYDYGQNQNLTVYQSIKPPSYNLNSIHVPIIVFYSDNDLLANPIDVKKLTSQLPKLIAVVKVYNPFFNHSDFIWSTDVNKQINNPIKKTLQKTDKKSWKFSRSKHSNLIIT